MKKNTLETTQTLVNLLRLVTESESLEVSRLLQSTLKATQISMLTEKVKEVLGYDFRSLAEKLNEKSIAERVSILEDVLQIDQAFSMIQTIGIEADFTVNDFLSDMLICLEDCPVNNPEDELVTLEDCLVNLKPQLTTDQFREILAKL